MSTIQIVALYCAIYIAIALCFMLVCVLIDSEDISERNIIMDGILWPNTVFWWFINKIHNALHPEGKR